MEKIEKVLQALDDQCDQYARMAKDEALQALTGPVKDKQAGELSAMNWYVKHKTMEEAIRLVKFHIK